MKFKTWQLWGLMSAILGGMAGYSSINQPQRAEAVPTDAAQELLGQQPKQGGIGISGLAKAAPGVTFSRLYRFSGPDGKYPLAGLLAYNNSFYGTTSGGGLSCERSYDYGCGTLFKFSGSTLSTLHYFGSEGFINDRKPTARLTRDAAGNIFGTTSGDHSTFSAGPLPRTRGSIFKLSPDNTFTTIHSFHLPGRSGLSPNSSLVLFGKDYLYGTTDGSRNFPNTLFRVSPQGRVTVLHMFSGPEGDPTGALISDGAGNLYGTSGEVFGAGTIFKLNVDGTFSRLYDFKDKDGGRPVNLVRDKKGNLFGSTDKTIFKLSSDGVFSILYSFNFPGFSFYPRVSSLILDSAGNLYGTTTEGGANKVGTVFSIGTDGTFNSLFEFGGKGTGVSPAGLTLYKGDLYGVTTYGGPISTSPFGKCRSEGCGTIFKLGIKSSAPARMHLAQPILQSPPEDNKG